MNDWNRGNVHGVAGVSLERPNAALAQDNFVVAARQQIFRRTQQFFDGGRDAALEQHRFAHLAQFAKQVEILHISRAHLEDVDIGQHQFDLRNLHDFADHQQFEMIARLAQQLQSVKPQPLK